MILNQIFQTLPSTRLRRFRTLNRCFIGQSYHPMSVLCYVTKCYRHTDSGIKRGIVVDRRKYHGKYTSKKHVNDTYQEI